MMLLLHWPSLGTLLAALPAAVCWQPSHLAESQVTSPMAYPKLHEERSGALSLGACRVLRPYRQLKLPAGSRNLRAAPALQGMRSQGRAR